MTSLMSVTLSAMNTTNASMPGQADDGEGYPLGVKVVMGLVLASIQLTAFFGNLLVCITLLTDRILTQSSTSVFLLSLALADMLISIMVMPFALVHDITGKWAFGSDFCTIWISCDITCETASILSLCLVCVDRFLKISFRIVYHPYSTKTKLLEN
ncbi:hypothetical protein ACOMHN_059482 [Nucella lapillus]